MIFKWKEGSKLVLKEKMDQRAKANIAITQLGNMNSPDFTSSSN